MMRNNVKLLTDTQLRLFMHRYQIDYDGTNIIVKPRLKKRYTHHDANKPFHINAKNLRKICFTMDAINIWKELYNPNTKLPSLFMVQQAVNILFISLQPIDIKHVKEILDGKDFKIKNC